MPTYAKAPAEVRETIADVLRRFHGELLAAEVTVDALMVGHSGESADPDTSAVKLHGYECAAVVRVTPLKQRARGIADAQIEIDSGTWQRLSAAERLALIDHELTHLELIRDREGLVKGDDCGRPRLKCRLHDWQLGGFRVIAVRHGAAALEAQAFQAAHRKFYQAVFSWGDDFAPADDLPASPLAHGVAEDDAWRSVPLDSLDLPRLALTVLEHENIRTVGDLADWSAPPPQGKGRRLVDIDGIGEATAEKIDEALERFWASRAAVEHSETPGLDLDAELAAGCAEVEATAREHIPPEKSRRGRKAETLDPVA